MSFFTQFGGGISRYSGVAEGLCIHPYHPQFAWPGPSVPV